MRWVRMLMLFSLELMQISRGNAALPPVELNAVEVLRDTFHLSNWTGDPCGNVTWIKCSGITNSKVETLDLTSYNLTGNLPAEISNLQNLLYLLLADNPQLSGPLPDLSGLSLMQIFNARNCSLTGNIPDLKTSNSLSTLDLQMNDFHGSIPAGLFQGNIRYMYLNDNPHLSGGIPSTSPLTAIENFGLQDCNLSGNVPSFNTATNMEFIYLQNNRLTSFPPDLQMLTQLRQIHLYNNDITGNLPDLPAASSQGTDQNYVEWLLFSNNQFSGEIPNSWYQLTYVQGMLLDYNNLSGSIQKEIGNLLNVKQLNLSHNHFSGPIPDEFGNLNKLEILDLRNNQFSGAVPLTLAKLPNLKALWLDNNNFTEIPQVLRDKLGSNMTYDSNVKIIGVSSKSGLSTGALAGIVVAVFGCILAFAVLAFIQKRRRMKTGEDQVSKGDMPKSATSFPLKTIKSITQNFTTLIGKGGFGSVYYGKLSDGNEVAVKVRSPDSKQGADEFLNEVRLLSRLHHRSLVSLVGYCLEAQQQILLYEYMEQGTLHDHLYRSGSSSNPSTSTMSSNSSSTLREILSWKKRLEVVIEAARGLEYLHKDCKPPIIHRDVKSANILLDDRLQAKVSDLGISKQAPELDTEEALVYSGMGVSTVIKGTFGYMDPEYYSRRRLTIKSDVYSFGVVLLEIITCKRPQTLRFPGSAATTLTEWVLDAVNANEVESIVDPLLGSQYDRESVLSVARIALSCLHPEGAQRPNMGDIVRTLTQALQMEGRYTDSSVPAAMDDESEDANLNSVCN
ncbi:hypothetical protein MPTK1_2g16590 [Marchantia polymorpha subsp. ruderalis]|uniref:Protein kinase domain-containing protein n=1 Tax=Marchantia polymorpha TaxID=3197 RepID=A0A2R6W9M9_MARPO|nr:hypothetical protein MARPO_0122s0004 [Marchantia polymorpha]BBN02606.1 hypothetical protein Mp_2g16590 [Marchantia polymorpha subsp. ruderalis]PTQ30561.1 hypothetical protein MARPO_0122s0004 [Marchantia polymorpha]PTQ30562.1 hypothetical protein MARPO_0122s0004 [Marchantia polymorpha]BBN02607.1 hypothetical protein Mp_2g16590 [Marchantia polymorpha subsp. ruderalis]|eukprot:PTQ30560.1 hypothetical protein MARPO_0122s0004 [Marchantia polymorpha]